MLEQTLAAVPLFIFMGILVEQAGLMERLFQAVQLMLSRYCSSPRFSQPPPGLSAPR